jgi:predicted enzyme related to lactoylglutathione lyase
MLRRLEIGIDCRNPEALAEFWSRALGYAVGDSDRAGVYLDLVPPSANLPVVYFQRVQEEKSGKNRVHLDLWDDEPEAAIKTLEGLGARRVGLPQTGSEGGWWQVMTDPEGNEFCVCRSD